MSENKPEKKEKKKIDWSQAKPRMEDFKAGLIIGVICALLFGSIMLANYFFIGPSS